MKNNDISECIQADYIKNFADFFETTDGTLPRSVVLETNSPTTVLHKIFKDCKKVEAAGGILQNDKGEVACIYRLGKWDIPKGKREKNESIPECAVREVEEELHLQGVTIGPAVQFPDTTQTYTLHTYKRKGLWNIKPTYWYRMRIADSPNLIPQTEEGIEQAIWVAPKELHNLKPIYPSITALLDTLA